MDDVDLQFGGADENFIEDIGGLTLQIKSVLAGTTEGERWSLVQSAGKNGLDAWRLLHRRFDSLSGGRRRTLLRAILSPSRVKTEELGTALQTWEGMVTSYNKKAFKLNEAVIADDFLASALEAMVPEELEKHLQLNASRLKKFSDMRQEVVQYYETRTGKSVKITLRDRMPSTAHDHGGARPMDVDALVWRDPKGKGKKGDPKGKGAGRGKPTAPKFAGYCNKCGKYGHKEADCWSGKGGPNAKAKAKATAKPDGHYDPKGKKGGKGDSKGKKGAWWSGKEGRPAGSVDQGGADAQGEPEMEHGALDMGSLDQQKRTGNDASSLQAHCVDGWLRCNLDTGAAITVLPKRWVDDSRKEDPNHRGYITASGERIADYGGLKLECTDENSMKRNFGGRISDVHKVLASASQVAKAGQMLWLEADGGYVIPRDGTIGKKLREELARLIDVYGDYTLLPVYQERGVYNFYLQVDDQVETSALGNPEPREAPQSGFQGQGTRL